MRTTRVTRLAAVACGGYLFVVALKLMQAAARGVAEHATFQPGAGGLLKALAAGWGGAMIVLSGSPVAGAAISLFDGGVLSAGQTFAMITGSRIGASFVILLVGFLYAFRRRDGLEHLSVGLATLAMTLLCYLPGVVLAYGIFRSVLRSVGGVVPGLLSSRLDVAVSPLIDLVRAMPAPLVFPAGIGVFVGAAFLLERGLPTLEGNRLPPGAQGSRRQWVWFGVGSAVAFATLSVSVSVTLLIPLLAKGIVRREEVVPYVAGANVTTLADTLAAALFLGNGGAAAIVASEAIGVLAVTIAVFGVFGIERVERTVTDCVDRVISRPRRLVLATGGFLAVPALAALRPLSRWLA